jgi:hypothetical protein
VLVNKPTTYHLLQKVFNFCFVLRQISIHVILPNNAKATRERKLVLAEFPLCSRALCYFMYALNPHCVSVKKAITFLSLTNA